ncbi:conserved hypothetical protein [Vibrio alginolyticus]
MVSTVFGFSTLNSDFNTLATHKAISFFLFALLLPLQPKP